MNRNTFTSALLPWLLWAAVPSAAAAQSMEEALAGAHRSAENAARDQYRHPAETLRFFGLQADSSVLEVAPGAGWYTEVLAPFLAQKGELTVATNGNYGYPDKLAGDPATYGRVRVVPFSRKRLLRKPRYMEEVADGSMDMVLTFRSSHNWIRRGAAPEIYRAFFRVLRPGGTLGVVQHRAAPGADAKSSAEQGYVPEDYLVQLAERAGFRLQERSEINANPRDTRDHPKGVWTLPPVLRLKDQDRDKYLAIGESDRMTLRFTKPTP